MSRHRGKGQTIAGGKNLRNKCPRVGIGMACAGKVRNLTGVRVSLGTGGFCPTRQMGSEDKMCG